MTLPNLLDGTLEFMTAAGQSIPDVPAIPTADTIALRLNMLLEEVGELATSIGFTGLFDLLISHEDGQLRQDADFFIRTQRVDIVEMVDAFLDIGVVSYGGALETAGVQGTNTAADEVTRSNLSKIVDGKVLRRADGKISKPDNYIGPDIAGALTDAGWIHPQAAVTA